MKKVGGPSTSRHRTTHSTSAATATSKTISSTPSANGNTSSTTTTRPRPSLPRVSTAQQPTTTASTTTKSGDGPRPNSCPPDATMSQNSHPTSGPHQSPLKLGMRVWWSGVPATVKFVGPTFLGPGQYAGLALDEALGDHNGTIDDTPYFRCPDKHGVLVPVVTVRFEPPLVEQDVVVGGVGALLRRRDNPSRPTSASSEAVPVTAPSTTSARGREIAKAMLTSDDDELGGGGLGVVGDDLLSPWAQPNESNVRAREDHQRKREDAEYFMYSTTTASGLRDALMDAEDKKCLAKPRSYAEVTTQTSTDDSAYMCAMATQCCPDDIDEATAPQLAAVASGSEGPAASDDPLSVDDALSRALEAYKAAVDAAAEAWSRSREMLETRSQALSLAVQRCLSVRSLALDDHSDGMTLTPHKQIQKEGKIVEDGDDPVLASDIVISVRRAIATIPTASHSEHKARAGLVRDGVVELMHAVRTLDETYSDEIAVITHKIGAWMSQHVAHVDLSAVHATEEFDEVVRRLQFEDEKRRVEQDSAHVDGEMDRALNIFNQREELQATLQKRCVERRDRLNDDASATKKSREAFLRDALNAQKMQSRLKHMWTDERERLRSKLLSVSAKREDIVQQRAVASSRYTGLVKEVLDTMRETLSAEQEAWDRRRVSFTDLAMGTAEREEGVARCRSLVGAHAERMDTWETELERLTVESRDLDGAISALDKALAALELCLRAIKDAEAVVVAALKERETVLWDMAKQTHEVHLSAFRALVLSNGEMSFRRQRALREMTRKADNLQKMYEIAVDSFSEDAKVLSQQRAECQKECDTLSVVIRALEEKKGQYETDFTPSGDALRAMGHEFVDPREELRLLDEQRCRKLLEYYTLQGKDDEASDDDGTENRGSNNKNGMDSEEDGHQDVESLT